MGALKWILWAAAAYYLVPKVLGPSKSSMARYRDLEPEDRLDGPARRRNPNRRIRDLEPEDALNGY